MRPVDVSPAKENSDASEWFYNVEGKKHGPLSSGQLQALAKSGKLKPTDKVWKEGMAQWVAASTIKGLFPSSMETVTAKKPSVAASTAPGTDKGRSKTQPTPEKAKKPRTSGDERELSEQGGRGKVFALVALAAVACVACLGGAIVGGAWYLNSGRAEKILAENKEKPLTGQVAKDEKEAPKNQSKDKETDKKEAPKDEGTDKKEPPPEQPKGKVTEKKEVPPEQLKDKGTEKKGTPPEIKLATYDFSKFDYTKGPNGQKLTERSGEEKLQSAGEPTPNLIRFVEQGFNVELPPEEIARSARIFEMSFSKRDPKAYKIYVKRKLALAAKKEPFVRPSNVRLRPDITDFRFVDTTIDKEKAEAFEQLYWYGKIPAKLELLADGKPVDVNMLKGFVRHGRTRGEYVLKSEARFAYENFWSNGKKHGTEKSLHPNGKPNFQGTFVDGKPVGEHKSFHSDGKPDFQGLFVDGKPVGEHKAFDMEGRQYLQGSYVDGKPVGLHKKKGFYEIYYDGNGIKDGISIHWNFGTKLEEGTYKAGRKIGVWTEWNLIGKKKQTETYLDGVLHGAVITYSPFTGQVASTEQWVNGQRHGLYTVYRQDGSVESVTRYVNGVRQN